jgi:hypothetical protein
MTTQTLLTATATSTGQAFSFDDNTSATFQASGIMSAGSGTAVVSIQVSNDLTNWLTAGSISLTLSTTSTSDGFAITAPWAWVRAKVDSISANGTVTTLMSV